MGFYSWKCKHCGRSLLSEMAVESHNAWMNDAVVLHKNGTRLIGSYDGYGRVNGNDVDEDPCCYHLACWEVAGKPEYDSPSKSSRDQGWFFEGEHYNLSAPPQSPEDPEGCTENVILRGLQ